MRDFFQKIKFVCKNVFWSLLHRLKPRMSFRWIFSFILWLIILVYVGFGIYFGIQIYTKQSDKNTVKTASNFYPYPAAITGGQIIWVKDYYQQLSYIERFSEKTKQPLPDKKTLHRQIIDQLVENKILELQALKYNVKVTSKDVNDAYQKIVSQSGGNSEVQKVLNELYGMTEKEFKSLVHDQVLKEKIQNELIVQVKVAHILIKDEGRANEIADRVKKGEDFAALAKQYSEDTKSRDNGGELGWLAKGQLVVNNNNIPEFDEAAFNAGVGTIVGPVKTSIGFEIIKIEDRKGKINESFNQWLGELKTATKTWRFIN